MLSSVRYGLSPAVATAIAQLCCRDGRLPMGGAASGAIANMIFGPLDSRLIRLSKRSHLRYSRYVDDITLSATNPESLREAVGVDMFGKFIVRDVNLLSPEFVEIFHSEGFAINASKVWAVSRQARQQVNSLIVNKKVNVRREYILSVRGALHSIEKFGIASAQETYEAKFKGAGSDSLIENIAGKLTFIGHVTGYDEKYTPLAQRFMAISSDGRLKTPLIDRDRSVYHLQSLGGEVDGSAFHIGNGVFLTAAHVLDGFSEGEYCLLHVPGHFPKPLAVEIAAKDRDIDVAVLISDKPIGRPHIDFSGTTVRRGTEAFAYGYPKFNDKSDHAQIIGTVTAFRKVYGKNRVEFSSILPHGMSGGPVISDHGKLAGMVFSGPEYGKTDIPLSNCFTPFSEFEAFVGEVKDLFSR